MSSVKLAVCSDTGTNNGTETTSYAATCTSRSGRGGGRSSTSAIGRLEPVECFVVEPAWTGQTGSFGRRGRGSTLGCGSTGSVERFDDGPALLGVSLEEDWLAVVSCSNDLVLGDEGQGDVGKSRGTNHVDGSGRLFGATGVDYGQTRVVADESKHVTARAEADSVNPTTSWSAELATNGSEGQSLTPDTGRRLSINTLDVSTEHSSLHVGTTSGQKHVVLVPFQRQHSRPERTLNVLGNPPVVVLLKRADADDPSTGGNGELVLVGTPSHESRSSIQAQEHKGRLPDLSAGLRVRLELPDVRVTILRAGDDAVGLRGPVDTGDELIVFRKGVLESPPIGRLSVDMDDIGVGGDGYFGSVGIERVCRERAEGQLVNLSRHCDDFGIGGEKVS